MPRKRLNTDEQAYEKLKGYASRRSREASAAGREIGSPPEVADLPRKDACRPSLRAFCEAYLCGCFPLPWSGDHLRAIERLQACSLHGGQYAFAMPRSSGKTTLCIATVLWALLYAHRSFVVLVGATAEAAEELLEGVKVELEANDRLADDFPEVCHPIRALDGEPRRANGQTLGGKRTRIGWTGSELVLPTVDGAHTSGAVLRVAGITGRVRGISASRADGTRIRPDLVVIDDPSTDDSARSPTQNASRMRTILGAVLGLAGPTRQIAAVMPCTVISPGDLADRLLDREAYPGWQGERSRLLLSWPTNERLWEEYGRVRAEGLRGGDGGAAATEFYRQHRPAMDAGALVSWPVRYRPGELSGIQYAMNLYLDDPISFAAEYQNEPLVDRSLAEGADLDADAITTRLSRLPLGTVPRDATRLTVGIDVQGKVLFWMACAWGEDFSGAIVDYGAWPEQNRAYFAATDARPSLEDRFPGLGETARIYAGLAALVDWLTGRTWEREEGGQPAAVERVLVDAGWGASTDTVYQLCRASPHKAVLLPSHGRGIGAGQAPMREWRARPGERAGRDWRLSSGSGGRGRHVVFDSNSWKTFCAERLTTPAGSPGALLLPGTRPFDHQLLADHITSEYRVRTQGRGRTVDEWKIRPDRYDNHYLDCLVLCAVGASVQGLGWSAAGAAGQPVAPEPEPQRLKLSEIQKRKRAERGRR